VEDTARSVQILRLAGPGWNSWRLGLDYYPEGELIWLEVDTTIRQQSHGQKSLNDFCRLFHGGQSGPPKVVPYTFENVVSALNQVVPYDWASLLRQRVNETSAHAPMGGIERGGWHLTYSDQPNLFVHAEEKLNKGMDTSDSLGLRIGDEGKLVDVIYGSPTYAAGIGPGMKLIAVNGRKYAKDVLAAAIQSAKANTQPIDLLVENANFYKTYSVPYHDGIRNPHLERAGGDDLLGEILKPLSK
jgi:predicted metalloprotease with PDZ domain